MAPSVAKSGWLFRQSTFLKKWKRNWFVLSTDGYLRYYENETSNRAENAIVMPVQVATICSAAQVRGVQPPGNQTNDGLLALKLQDGGSLILCAETGDDMKAWQLALEQARVFQPYGYRHDQYFAARPVQPYGVTSLVHPMYPQSAVYPGQVLVSHSSPYGNYVVQTPNGPTTIVVDRQRSYNSGSNLALGMVAGAALGTMMWSPFLWC